LNLYLSDKQMCMCLLKIRPTVLSPKNRTFVNQKLNAQSAG